MAGASEPFAVKEVTVGHVVMLAAQGKEAIQIKPQELQTAFGRFGPANVGMLPNGYIVQLGPANHLLFQPPRVEFKSASEEMLKELFQNISGQVLGPFVGKAASAYGFNFELEVTFGSMSAAEFFQKLQPRHLPQHTSLNGAKFKTAHLPKLDEVNYLLEWSSSNPVAVNINVNRHLPNPNSVRLQPPELLAGIEEARTSYRDFLHELHQCVQSHN